MPKHTWILLCIFCVILAQVLTVPFASAEDNADDNWSMFHHDLNHVGVSNSTVGNGAEVLWVHPTGWSVWSSPVTQDGCVYVGSKDKNIYCLNASSGEQIWAFKTVGEVDSSPAIWAGRVYVGSDDGWFYCINASSGYPVWISFAGGLVRSSPAVAGDRVFVGSGKHDLLCFNASDGSLLWNFPTQYRVDCSPAVSDGTIYIASNINLYAINASTGKEIWHRYTGSESAPPTVSDDAIYIGSYDGVLYCLNATTNKTIWQYRTGDTIISAPTIAYGCVYVTSEDGAIYCLNSSTGQKIWSYKTAYWSSSSPAIADGNVYFGSRDYSLYCLNATTGEKQWSYQTGSIIDSSPAISNGILYVGSYDHSVYAFNLSDAKIKAPLKEVDVSWPTVAFDAFAIAVFALASYTAVYFFRLSRRNRQSQKSPVVFSLKKGRLSGYTNFIVSIIIIAFTIISYLSLSSGPMWAADEKTYSANAFHMIKSGDYITPWDAGELAVWVGKPPIQMWLMSLSYQVLGVTNFASRLWSPLFGAFTLALVYLLGRRFYNSTVGLLSVLVLGSSTLFSSFSTHAMMDGPLLFFIVSSIYCMLLAQENEKGNLYAALSGVLFGLALMTKGFEALLIPLILIPYFVLTKRSPRFLFTKHFAYFIGIAALIFLPWLIYMDLSFKDFYDCFFSYNFIRSVSPVEGHIGGSLFYFKYLASTESPLWTLLMPFAVGLAAFKSFVKRSKPDILLLIWVVVVFAVFTVAQTKIYWYILPSLPALALVTSSLIYQVADKTCTFLQRRKDMPYLSAK